MKTIYIAILTLISGYAAGINLEALLYEASGLGIIVHGVLFVLLIIVPLIRFTVFDKEIKKLEGKGS